MADNDVSFSLNLDIAEFTAGLQNANKVLKDFGASDQLSGLIAGFETLAAGVGALAIVYGVLKTSMDATFETEGIEALNTQFETLSKNAGISSDALRDGLLKSANGLISETDLLKEANKAIIAMGASAQDLPAILDVATKSAQITGGTVKDNFDLISSAIERGNMRMLRQIGINIDAKKALQDYASSINVTVDSLSQAGQKQALLNAVIENGKTKMGGVATDLKPATTAFNQLKVSISEMGEAISALFSASTSWKNIFDGLKQNVTDFTTFLKSHFGSGATQAGAKVDEVSTRIAYLKSKIDEINSGKSMLFPSEAQIQLTSYNAELDQLNKKLIVAKISKTEFDEKAKESAGTTSGPAPVDNVNREAQQKQALKFEQDLISMRESNTRKEIAFSESIDEVHKKSEELEQMANDRERLAIEQIDNEVKTSQITAAEGQKKKVEVHRQAANEIEQINKDLVQQEIQADQNRLYNATRVDQQLEASAKLTAAKTADDWKKSGGVGGAAMTSFQSRTTQAFKNIGSGAQSVSDAMKSAFLGMIGDIASKQGEFMMLDSFKTFPAVNGPEFAAGAALVALGGLLGASASGSAGAASGGGGGGYGPTDSAGTTSSVASAAATPQKSVTVAIQGNYFDTDQTRTRLMEMVREATDATDFKYVQIGQS